MLELVTGVALWASPPPVKFPGVAALALFRALRSRRRDNKQRQASSSGVVGAVSVNSDEGVELVWKDLTMTLAPKKSGGGDKTANSDDAPPPPPPPKSILNGVSGAARPGRLLAILGPSGSGKTSLLNTLAMQVPANKRMTLRGRLTANGSTVGGANNANGGAPHRTAYVQQEDMFYSQLTVAETLAMAAKLRLPRGTSKAERDAAVASLLQRLGLTHVGDTRVGDKKTRGISGGEKKRLSLACELVGRSPAVVCCDEPTSGLDSFQAQRVMEALRSLVRPGVNHRI